jgi:serine protease AprX
VPRRAGRLARSRRRDPELESQSRQIARVKGPGVVIPPRVVLEKSATAPELATCPLCGEAVDPRVLARHPLIETRIERRIREAHSGWRREQGACMECVSWALEEVGRNGAPAPHGRPAEILSLPTRLQPDPHHQGRGVTVALLDSDFVFHVDLLRPRRRIVTYVDASTARVRADTVPPPPYLGSWHGTMTAGSSFGSGVVAGGRYPGLATEAGVVLVRIAGRRVRMGEAQIVRGLDWVLAHHDRYGIRVVNLSIGGDEPEPSRRNRLDRLVARAVGEGIVVVAAAGNRPDRLPVAPASAPEAITVGGVDDLGLGVPGEIRLWPSSHGPTLDGVEKPDLLAPSIWVPAPMVPGTPQTKEAAILLELEALPDELLRRRLARRVKDLPFPRDILRLPVAEIRGALADRRDAQKFLTPHHQHVDGTSFAAAIVSATVAQMLEANPRLEPDEVKAVLMATARPLPGVPRSIQGAGVIQPGAAVRVAAGFDLPRSPVLEGDRVRYVFRDPKRALEEVEWAGALSGWRPQPMRSLEPGLWILEHPRPAAGEYPYKLLMPDGRWLEDPANPRRTADGFGGWNSVLVARRG